MDLGSIAMGSLALPIIGSLGGSLGTGSLLQNASSGGSGGGSGDSLIGMLPTDILGDLIPTDLLGGLS
ncbi:hypothetical protein NCCP2495_11310 [Dietzia sp. NCCP-2495]|uniref:hypothetical protein n=1 Tax=Dietzia sp. NCCP-2495 TaxID=2934675 RepID=UPI00223100B5|nr:hypothetical protein [Dietzia sp. NCCP-2495]GLB63253.1 hypothetical protein NCCP2495_11310 [Dietzia sp. NCCP-2495]